MVLNQTLAAQDNYLVVEVLQPLSIRYFRLSKQLACTSHGRLRRGLKYVSLHSADSSGTGPTS
jgi:hypothetical protein